MGGIKLRGGAKRKEEMCEKEVGEKKREKRACRWI